MTRGRRPLLLLAGLAALAPAAPALAAPPAPAPTGKVAVFSIDGFGLGKKVALAPVKLTALLGTVLAAQGLEVVTPPLGPADLSMALDCGTLDAGCHAKMVAYLGVDGLVLGELRGMKGKVRVKLTLWSGGPRVVAREVAEVVELTAATADAELERLARAFEGVVPPPPVPIVVVPVVVPEVAPPVPEVTPPPRAPPPPGFRLSVPGVVVAGAGVVLLGGSVVAGLNTARLNRMYEGAPSEDFDDLHELQDIERRGRTSATITRIALAAGGVVLATGFVLIAVGAGAGRGDEPGARTSMVLSAGFLPGGGLGASVRVPFLESR